MTDEVVSLGAWCDLDPPGLVRRATPGAGHVNVLEFAILADGRRVTVRGGLGCSWLPSRRNGERPDPWLSQTRERMEHTVLNVVMPDDDDSPDPHPYEWLRSLLRGKGIETSVEHLRSVPYTIEFSDRLEERLEEARVARAAMEEPGASDEARWLADQDSNLG